MAEPLSLISSIISVITLAEHIISASVLYSQSVRSQHSSFKKLVQEVSGLTILFGDIKETLEDLDPTVRHVIRLPDLDVHLSDCREVLRTFVEILSKSVIRPGRSSKLVKQLLWPLQEAETTSYIERLERLKTTFSIALEGLLVRITARIADEQLKANAKLIEHQQDERFIQVMRWMSTLDYTKVHRQASRDRQPLTGLWFFQCPEFLEWQQDSGSFLWIHAIPGAGKTVLISTIINELESTLPPGHGFAYFYCRHDDQAMRDPTEVIRSIAVQICKNSRSLYCLLEEFQARKLGHIRPQLDGPDIIKILTSEKAELPETIIIIDALDECGESREASQPKLIEFLLQLRSAGKGKLKVLVASRKEYDIMKKCEGLPNISLQGEEVAKDIELYLRVELEARILDGRLLLRNRAVIEPKIVSAILDQADGMFLYVKFQLDYLCNQFTDDDISEALHTLPGTLYQTYLRILEALDKQNAMRGKRKLGQKIIRYIAEAIRPMTLDELAELTSIKDDQEEMKQSAVPTESKVLVRLCGSLVRVNHDTNEIFLAHYSIKEFLVSETSQREEIVSSYHASTSDVNTEIAKASLTYLAFKDFSGGPVPTQEDLNKRLRDYRYLGYAVGYAGEHLAKVKEPRADLLRLLEKIFVPPTRLEDFTGSPEVLDLLQKITFGCDLEDGFTTYPKIEDNYDVFVHTYVCHPSKEAGCPDGSTHIIKRILESLKENVWTRSNSNAWLQIYRTIKLRSHPACITPLYYASLFGWSAGVEIILETTYAKLPSSDLNHALRGASIGENNDVVKLLLGHGANVKSHGDHLGSALQSASYSSHEDVVRTLLENGADAEEEYPFFRNGGTIGCALQAAVKMGSKKIAKVLLDAGADINNSGGFIGTPLVDVLEQGSKDMAQFLIENGADGSVAGGLYGSAMIMCSQMDILRLMLDHGADVNRRVGVPKNPLNPRRFGDALRAGVYGDALQSAAFAGQRDKLELFIERGANINAPHGQYGTAIQAAALNGDENNLKLLLDAGADPNCPGCWLGDSFNLPVYPYYGKFLLLTEGQGYRPCSTTGFLGLTIKAGVALQQEYCNDIVLLFENEATNHFNHYGNPLQAASLNGNDKNILLLIESGAIVNKKGGFYGTALQAAAAHGHDKAVKLLLDKNANPNIVGGRYGSALQAAIIMGHPLIVNLLLQAGADLDISDEHGWTASMCAAHYNKNEVEKVLSTFSRLPATSSSNPTALSKVYKSPKLELDEVSMEARYLGDEDEFANIAAAIRANHPVPIDINYYYFEVEILDRGQSGVIGVGICDGMIPLHRMPGWDLLSWGYHGKDGKCSFEQGKSDAVTFGTNDIVGCGVKWEEGICFFTRNGLQLDQTAKISKGRFYPTVGIASKGACVRMNFGDRPFVFSNKYTS